jgi:hypothetical protein
MAQQTIQVEDLILPGVGQVQDVKRISLVTNDYVASSTGLPRLDRGFYLRSDTAGEFEVITLSQLRRKLFDKSSGITLADPLKISNSERNDLMQAIAADEGKITIYVEPGVWNGVPLVFVEKTGAAVDHLDIGII